MKIVSGILVDPLPEVVDTFRTVVPVDKKLFLGVREDIKRGAVRMDLSPPEKGRVVKGLGRTLKVNHSDPMPKDIDNVFKREVDGV